MVVLRILRGQGPCQPAGRGTDRFGNPETLDDMAWNRDAFERRGERPSPPVRIGQGVLPPSHPAVASLRSVPAPLYCRGGAPSGRAAVMACPWERGQEVSSFPSQVRVGGRGFRPSHPTVTSMGGGPTPAFPPPLPFTPRRGFWLVGEVGVGGASDATSPNTALPAPVAALPSPNRSFVTVLAGGVGGMVGGEIGKQGMVAGKARANPLGAGRTGSATRRR